MTKHNELMETIEKALEKRKKFIEPGLDESWLRALMEENKQLQGSYMFRYSLSLELEVEKLKEELKQVKAERDEVSSKYDNIRNHLKFFRKLWYGEEPSK